MNFEWDDKKAAANYIKHGVRFSEVPSDWLDPNAIEVSDTLHSIDEERWIRMGLSHILNLLVVCFVEKRSSNQIRIISARHATKRERAHYFLRQDYER